MSDSTGYRNFDTVLMKIDFMSASSPGDIDVNMFCGKRLIFLVFSPWI